jgi:hypothetical protein
LALFSTEFQPSVQRFDSTGDIFSVANESGTAGFLRSEFASSLIDAVQRLERGRDSNDAARQPGQRLE